jgi:hypothetical protein
MLQAQGKRAIGSTFEKAEIVEKGYRFATANSIPYPAAALAMLLLKQTFAVKVAQWRDLVHFYMFTGRDQISALEME